MADSTRRATLAGHHRPKAVSALEAARAARLPHRPAHDAFTRLLHRLEPDPAALWREVEPLLRKGDGVLVVDDATPDKPYAAKIALVCQHWPGKHRAVVWGIKLISLLGSDGDRLYPVDYRAYAKADDGRTKNDHARELLATAPARGFRPRCLLFDQWYASLDNLKHVRALGWTFLAPLKANRLVNRDGATNRPLARWPIAATGTVVPLRGFGPVKVFRIVATNGDTEYWATNDLRMTALQRQGIAELAWSIEEYHRGLKQYTGVERCQCRAAAPRNHVGLAIRAFVRLECHRFTTGVTWFQAKLAIVREAVRRYLANPLYRLPSTA
jgi:hypothetical protein